MRSMNYPPEVAEMLDRLLTEIQHTLGENLVGLYLRGSLVTGDFIPETSDLDLMAITERPIDAAGFEALAAMHAHLAASPNRYANRVEITYLDRAAARRFEPGLRHPTLGQGETLAWSEHGANWLLERWSVRAHGVALRGPDPQSLIDPVPAAALRAAVRNRLRDWADWANDPADPDWQLPRRHKAYVVETMCRILYTLARGTLASKPQGVAWALTTLPEPWRSTVDQSQAWRADDTHDPSLIPVVRDFVRWVAAVGED